MEKMTRVEILGAMGITRAGLFRMIKVGSFPAPVRNWVPQVWDRQEAMVAIERFNTRVSEAGYVSLKNAWDSIKHMTKDEFGASDIAGDHPQTRCVILRTMHVFGMVEPTRKSGRSQLYRRTEMFESLYIVNPFMEKY